MNVVISNLFQSMDNISVCVYSMARNNRVNCNIVNIFIKKKKENIWKTISKNLSMDHPLEDVKTSLKTQCVH